MVFKRLIDDVDAYLERDPAARSRVTIFFSYPGLHAVIWHRAAHWLWQRRWFFVARLVSHFSRWVTGVEIHPAARIGRRLVIDHGMGVVVGETAEICDNVTLYHGVTLGGIAPAVDSEKQKRTKRHPTIRDRAIVGSGAQVLGPITVGESARVGANAVVVKDVAPGATVVGIPAKPIYSHETDATDEFAAYGTPTGDLPDPLMRVIDGLMEQVGTLQARVEELEREREPDHNADLDPASDAAGGERPAKAPLSSTVAGR